MQILAHLAVNCQRVLVCVSQLLKGIIYYLFIIVLFECLK